MKKEKSKLPLRTRICNALELSPEVLPRTSLIELHGDSLVKIQGGGKILLYTDNEIRIGLKGKKSRCLSVVGECLSCSSYNMGAVGIAGKIISLTFLEEDKK